MITNSGEGMSRAKFRWTHRDLDDNQFFDSFHADGIGFPRSDNLGIDLPDQPKIDHKMAEGASKRPLTGVPEWAAAIVPIQRLVWAQ